MLVACRKATTFCASRRARSRRGTWDTPSTFARVPRSTSTSCLPNIAPVLQAKAQARTIQREITSNQHLTRQQQQQQQNTMGMQINVHQKASLSSRKLIVAISTAQTGRKYAGHVIGHFKFNLYYGGGGGGGGLRAWVNFCWVCAAGLSEPLYHFSIFCGHIK